MKLKTKRLLLRTVSYDDLDEVARMWNFERGEITRKEANEAIYWMSNNHKRNKPGKIIHLCFAIHEKHKNKMTIQESG